MLGSIVEDLPFESGAKTLLFVNGMGGTPQIELYLAYHSARKFLSERGIEVTRSLVGLHHFSGDARHVDSRC